MSIRVSVIAFVFALLGAGSGAQATTYTFTFTGQDFASPVSFTLNTPFSPSGQGFPGGPYQTWGSQTSTTNGGWMDFYTDNTSLTLEATNLGGNVYMTAAAPFYNLTSSGSFPSTQFHLDLGFTSGTHVVPLTASAGWLPNFGNVDSLSIAAVPEASTWAMMLLGFAGLGFAGYRASRRAQARAA